MQKWMLLMLAIVCEVIGTSSLKASEGFTRLWPSVIVIVGYAVSFYLLSLTLKTIPVGIVYAIWAGAGIALISFVAWIFLGQALDFPAILGILLIISGVMVINIFSKVVSH